MVSEISSSSQKKASEFKTRIFQRSLQTTATVCILFVLLFVGRSSYSIIWINKAGLDKNNFIEENGQRAFLWTSLRDRWFEAGYYKYGNKSQMYGGLDYAGESVQIQAGSIYRSMFSGFLVSQGEYLPGENSTPDVKPIGFSIKLLNKNLFWFSGSYFRFNPENRSSGFKDHLHMDYAGFRMEISKWFFETGGIVSTMQIIPAQKWFQDKYFFSAIDPGLYFHTRYEDMFGCQVLYSVKYGWFANMNFSIKDIMGDIYLISFKEENPLAAMLYRDNRKFYISLWNTQFKTKIYNTRNLVKEKSTIKINNIGFYHYISIGEQKNMTGIFYHSEKSGLAPYLSVYVSPGLNLVTNSMGINFNNEWMFALIHSKNSSSIYYPYDEQIIPDRFYSSSAGLDSETSSNHSYFGFQFFVNLKSLFCYASIAQNYAEKKDENLSVIVRLEYSKTF